MKKAAAICMTLAMVVSLNAGFTSLADDQTALERVLEKGKLVVATDAAWPPFEYMEGENVVGVDLDIAKDIADGLGVDLEIINVSFDSLSMYLENERQIWHWQRSLLQRTVQMRWSFQSRTVSPASTLL